MWLALQVQYSFPSASSAPQHLQLLLPDPAEPHLTFQEHNISLTIAESTGKPDPTLCWVEGPGLIGSFAGEAGELQAASLLMSSGGLKARSAALHHAKACM